MRMTLSAVAVLAILGSATAAQAGCISGAVVGGVAGHMMGHGKVGAAAGCAIGHHNAKKAKQQQSAPADSQAH